MAKIKTNSSLTVLGVVFRGLKTYLNNLDIFMKYLSFPVLGTFIGAFLLFLINYLYMINIEKLQTSTPIFNNVAVLMTVPLILTVPGFLIMIKAMVDYIVAFGAINSMCVLNDKRIVDVGYHNEVIKRRFAPYCVLIIVLSLIFSVLSFPLLLPVLLIALIFLALSVQVFTLEENSSPFEAMFRSVSLVKQNVWSVFGVLVLIFIISYVICPYLITWAISKTPLLAILANPIEKYILLFPIEDINTAFEMANIPYKFDVILVAESIINMSISTIVVMYMLPFRCACCVELYKGLSANNLEQYTNKEKVEKPKTKNKKQKR